MAGYDEQFYDSSATDVGRTSAASVVAEVQRYIGTPRSVVDVGCGNGAWASAFSHAGAETVIGVDGPWVDEAWLDIPREQFVRQDVALGLTLDRTFDLAVSLEVGEHLPAASADRFVADLVAAAPVVLFSAAIPYQGGTGHVNEQWPSYWAEKFAAHGYVPVDVLRAELWHRDDIAYFYRQNMTFYASSQALAAHPQLADAHARRGGLLPDLIHPEVWERRSRQPINVPRILGRERSERLRDWVNNQRRRRAGSPAG